MQYFKIGILLVSALALFYASSTRLFDPTNALFLETYFENPANSLATNSDLVNEIRGIGAVMLLAAIVTVLGIRRADFRLTAFSMLTVIFGGVVLGRSISIVIDGMPNTNLLRAMSAEVVLALLNIFCLIPILSKDTQQA
ncbi:MAG: DUF4345 domain-containing protein [Chloroflexota bacterium]